MALRGVLTIVFALLCVANAKFIDCGNPKNVESVKVNGEDIKDVAISVLKKGSDATIEVKFTANMNSTTSTSVCHGIIAYVPVPFPLKNTDGCTGMVPHCPIIAGTTYTFSNAISVSPEYPSLKVVIKWEEKASNKEDLFCIEFPAEIES